MRSVVDRAMAVVEFLVSWPWSTADGDIVLEERIDELAVLLELARRTDSSWTALHALLDRLLLLKNPLRAFFSANPSMSGHLSLLPSEWQAIREAASILDPAIEVVTKTSAVKGEEGHGQRQEGRDGREGGLFLAEAINLHANLHQSFVYPQQDIRISGSREGAVVESRQVDDLTEEAQAQLGALAEHMESSGLGRARENVEAMSMVLDPRLKTCCSSTCVDGGQALKLRALTALASELEKFGAEDFHHSNGSTGLHANGGGSGGEAGSGPTMQPEEGGGAAAGAGAVGTGASSSSPSTPSKQGAAGFSPPMVAVRKLSRLEKMRQAQDFVLGGHSSSPFQGAGGRGGSSDAMASSSYQLDRRQQRAEDAVRELGEYMVDPPGKRRDLLAYWKLHGSDTRDSGTGKMVLAARWPHLGLLARLYAGVGATSRQEERHSFEGGGGGGGDLGLAVNALQGKMSPRNVEKMVFIRLNRHLVPEVIDRRRRAAAIAAAANAAGSFL